MQHSNSAVMHVLEIVFKRRRMRGRLMEMRE
jgi:hypothetical protein